MALDAIAFASPDLCPGSESGITYTPHGGSPRTINAQVERIGLETRDGVIRRVVTLLVRNDATYGISAPNFGRDTVTIALTRGGTAEVLIIHMPGDGAEFIDGGMIRVEAY